MSTTFSLPIGRCTWRVNRGCVPSVTGSVRVGCCLEKRSTALHYGKENCGTALKLAYTGQARSRFSRIGTSLQLPPLSKGPYGPVVRPIPSINCPYGRSKTRSSCLTTRPPESMAVIVLDSPIFRWTSTPTVAFLRGSTSGATWESSPFQEASRASRRPSCQSAVSIGVMQPAGILREVSDRRRVST